MSLNISSPNYSTNEFEKDEIDVESKVSVFSEDDSSKNCSSPVFDSIDPYDFWKADYDVQSSAESETMEPLPLSTVKKLEDGENEEMKTIDESKKLPIPNTCKRRKKPKGMPKRPLSAYNLFFRAERAKILNEEKSAEDENRLSAEETNLAKTSHVETNLKANSENSLEDAKSNHRRRAPHRKIGFSDLGKCIGSRWKNLPEDQRKKYQDLANEESERYKMKMRAYKSERENQKKKARNETSMLFESVKRARLTPTLGNDTRSRRKTSSHETMSQGNYFKMKATEEIPLTTTTSANKEPNLAKNPNEQQLPGNPPLFYRPHQPNVTYPPYSIAIPDSNGIPRMYRFTYAAVPMSPRSAERFMSSFSQQQSYNPSSPYQR